MKAARRGWMWVLMAALVPGLLWVSCAKKETSSKKPEAQEHAGHAMPSEQAPHMEHEPGPPPEGSAPSKEEQKTVYHCPMHPEYTSDKPGNCPICGMNLVPVKPEGKETEREQHGALHIPQEKLRAIGVTFGVAERRKLEKRIRLVGRITYDETRLKEVNTKFSGWVESLHVDFVGKVVRAGEPLLAVYSPELVAAQEEYLLALRAKDSSPELLEAARRKLLLWDLSETQIGELERNGVPFRVVTLSSPVTGFVIDKTVFQGKHIEAGETLYRVADISRVWLRAAVYEEDLPFLRLGQRVAVELVGEPERKLHGTVDYINPYLDEATRTAEVRVTLANPDGRIMPGMYASVEVSADLGERLVVPEQAVVFSGERYLVFVDRGEGTLEPREIRTGARTNDFIEVLGDIAPGERVVTSANFLIDSESKLRLALSRAHAH
ncbi:MAG: efflux RND transporter periplasmic adaptor subunit [Calditrichaeota bacterium]|nr:efflux RND transporter periplasmic adaptor subunit [Calditrichota bacterium]